MMKRKYTLLLAVVAGLLFQTRSLLAQEAPSFKGTAFGKGINMVAADSSFSLKMGLRFQTLFVAEQLLNDEDAELETQMLIRRARLKFEGFAYTPKLEYKVELGLSNRDIGKPISQAGNASSIVLDAVLKWEMIDNLELWVGQTKLPGNRERVISSQALQFVDRSIVNSEYNIDRDMGLQLHYAFNAGKVIFRPIAAVSMGEGRNITVKNIGGYDYTGRLEILPFGKFESKGDYVGGDIYREETPKLSLAAGYDYNDNAVREQGQLGDFLGVERDLSSLFADMMFKYQGFSVMAEYIDKTVSNPLVLDTSGVIGAYVVGSGLNAQAGYVFKNNIEVAGRYSTVMPDKKLGEDDVTQYTLGVSKYIKNHSLKVQSDISYTEIKNSDTPELMFRMQVEMAF